MYKKKILMSALSNLMFLSQGMQIAVFVVFVVLILIFMKMATMEKRISDLNSKLEHYHTKEEFLLMFQTMWEAKSEGVDLTPVISELASEDN